VTNCRDRRTVTWSQVKRVVVGFKYRLKASQWIEIVSYVERQRVPQYIKHCDHFGQLSWVKFGAVITLKTQLNWTKNHQFSASFELSWVGCCDHTFSHKSESQIYIFYSWICHWPIRQQRKMSHQFGGVHAIISTKSTEAKN